MDYKEMARELLANGGDTEEALRQFMDAVNDILEERNNQTQYSDAIDTLVDVWNEAVEAYCDYKGIKVDDDYYMTAEVMQQSLESTIGAVDLAHKISNTFTKKDKNTTDDFEKAITELLSGIIN